MKDVYFKSSNGDSCKIGEADDADSVMSIIGEFLEQHNFKSYYTRTWTDNGIKWYDVGSHTEFFYHEVMEE